MPAFASGQIECYVGPPDLGAPDDLEVEIVRFIDGATKTLDVAVQELDSIPIAEALIRARLAGRSVKIVLNHSYLQDEKPKAPAPTTVAELAELEGTYRENREVFAALCRCGIEVRIDFNHDHIFHQKFIVRDLRLGTERFAAGDAPGLLTGSTNFTHTDCHTNLNHTVVFHNRAVAEEYGKEFREIWTGWFGRGLIGPVPATHFVEGVPVKVLFAPDHGPEAEIIKQMLKCPKSGRIDFAIFTFQGSSGIDDAMIVLDGADRTVAGAIDPGQSRLQGGAAPWLVQSQVDLRVPNAKPGFRKLHHKLMVIDRATVLAGSFNYTEPANLYNDENLFVIGSPHDEVDKKPVDHAKCAEIADYFRTEIDRIMGDASPFVSN